MSETNGSSDIAALFEQAWTAPMRMFAAFAGAGQALLEHRGAPAMQAMLKQAGRPDLWTGPIAPFLEEMLEVFDLPQLADLPVTEPSALPSLVPAAELVAVTQQYMMAALSVGLRTCQRFQAEMARRRAEGGTTDSAGEALDVWNNVLDQVLMEFNRSDEFAAVQQRFVRAAMRQRQEVRKLTEGFARALDLPTRSELDEVHRRMHDMTRELHALRRELRALKQSAPAASPPQPARPAAKGARPA
ncbi:MAG TPA: poly(R)-hydroxyalkanoic acid synthase subunit PhaE [Acetobacteraceae bacterium]|nr:poly(R)-hydroxyalkanoic acid synthase subunit PhaE [Acetobacteraceae bacterium]